MTIYFLPFISAGIGWFTNYIAIKMLFHPRKEKNFYFFKLQGIFPKRKKTLARNLAVMVSQQLFTTDDLVSQMDDGNMEVEFKEKLNGLIDKYLEEELPKTLNPIMAALIPSKFLNKIKQSIGEEIDNQLPQLKEELVERIKAIDLEQVIYDKIIQFPDEQFEEVLMAVIKKELKYIEVAGAVLGFLIGLIQVGLLLVG